MNIKQIVFDSPNQCIHLTVKSVTFFAMQKNRPFLRQVMQALCFSRMSSFDPKETFTDENNITTILIIF